MNSSEPKFLSQRLAGLIGFVLLASLGLALLYWDAPLGKRLRFASYDWSYYLPFSSSGSAAWDDIVLVYLDEKSHQALKQPFNKPWDRALHARLLDRLTRDGAKAVVFDIIFSDRGPDAEADQAFAEAIRRNGRVVLGADYQSEEMAPQAFNSMVTPPDERFAKVAAQVGLARLTPDEDWVIRQHWHGPQDGRDSAEPNVSLTWATAEMLGAEVTRHPNARFQERWLNYYKGPGQIPCISYCLAEEKPAGFYRNKIVIIGASPITGFFGERRDEYREPKRSWYSQPVFIPAVNVHATQLQNLLHEDWLRRLPNGAMWFILLLGGVVFGYWLTYFRPAKAIFWATGGAGAVVLFSVAMLGFTRTWFPWLLVVAIQIPAGLLWSIAYRSMDWYFVRRALEAGRRQADQRIREQAALLDKAQDAIMVHDLEGRITYWNRSAERLYGWTAAEALDQDMTTRLAGPDPSSLDGPRQAVLSQGEWMGQLKQLNRAGREVVVESRWTRVCDDPGRPKSILSINTDITEKKKLESQLLRTQRLESLGTLAGGIAHDLNNVLTPIMMATQLMQMGTRNENETKLLKNIEISAQRGAGMVKQVLTFARGQEGEKVVLQIRHIIREIEKIMRETFPKSVEFKTHIASDLTPIKGDPTQLHQVLLNLCVNARDAMPEGGELFIEGINVTLDAEAAGRILGAKAGPYVSLRVCDTGAGIPPEIIDRIFEPFFTTKEVGKGTGLGLSTVMSILKTHGALLDVQSTVGQGTAFTILFPPAEQAAEAKTADAPLSSASGGGATVLVVDDEPLIRDMLAAILSQHHYHVLTAENGAQGVELFKQHAREINLVMVDMMMPVMDGKKAMHAMRQVRRDTKFIAISGLAQAVPTAEEVGEASLTILSKPFTSDKVLATLEDVIREERSH